MKTWTVYSLDVWGHSPSECTDACWCFENGEHIDTRCQCSYDVNDRCHVGTIETSDDAPDAEVWCALIESGIAQGVISRASFSSDDECTICIDDAKTGKPAFQLECETGV